MSDFGNTNKKDYTELYVFVGLAVFAVFAGLLAGYAVECEGDIMSALSALPVYISPINIKNASGALANGGATVKGLIGGIFCGGMLVLYQFTKSDKRYHRKGSEHGSARWGTQKEKEIISDTNDFFNNLIAASDVFLVLDRKKREEAEKKASKSKPDKKEKEPKNNTDLTVNNKMSVREMTSGSKKSRKIKPMLNLNMMILGGSGTGKSRFFVKPNIMQCNCSYVVTDPAGELVQSCGKMLERCGYKVKVFNINDMKHSSNYNPFHYLRDSTGKINNNNVIKMINVFMQNTKAEGTSSGDQFWDDATRLLLSALCFLIVETAETEEEQNFSAVLDLIHLAKVIEGKEEQKSELDLIFDQRKEESPNALSVQYYDEFKQAAGKTMQSILISTTTKLQHFKLEDVRNLTFKDNIELETIGDEKTALFIIIPSTDTTYNFLAAMMYTQLFDTLYDRAINKFHGRLPVHVQFLLDEFANIGKIPDFEKVLATCRKFEIGAVVILQSLSQLKRIYEKSWEEPPGNADTLIYLGGQDQFTNEWLMKTLGKETIDTLAINKTKSKQGSTSFNDGILGRDLATIDELSTMDNNDCVVIVRGMHPFFTSKFNIENHLRYPMLEESDKANNTYLLAENITTETETIIIDFSEFYNNSYSDNGEIIEIVFINGSDNTEHHEEKESEESEFSGQFRDCQIVTIGA